MWRFLVRLTIWLYIGVMIAVLAIMGFGSRHGNTTISFLAEVDDETDIYLYDPIQRDVTNLTETRFREWSFAWSDGGALLYTATVRGGQISDDLFVMQRLGLSTVIETPDTLNTFGGVWSPDGQTLAYFSSHPRNISDIYTITFPDLMTHNITQTPSISELNPLWSPTGNQLSYEVAGDLYLHDLMTGERRLLADVNGVIDMPVWSPDGQYVAFNAQQVVNGQQRWRGYVVRVEDGVYQTIALPDNLSSLMTWSPDSQRIAVIMAQSTLVIYDLADDRYEIVDGENLRFSPAWSPDGRWIAYLESRQLHLYDVASGDIQSPRIDGQVRPPLLWRR